MGGYTYLNTYIHVYIYIWPSIFFINQNCLKACSAQGGVRRRMRRLCISSFKAGGASRYAPRLLNDGAARPWLVCVLIGCMLDYRRFLDDSGRCLYALCRLFRSDVGLFGFYVGVFGLV